MSQRDSRPITGGQDWLFRQNIARFKAMLANPGKQDCHDQIRALLKEEEAKLQALEEGRAPDPEWPL